jgi:uncharacterized protein YneR
MTEEKDYFYFADEDLMYQEEDDLPEIPPFPSIFADPVK